MVVALLQVNINGNEDEDGTWTPSFLMVFSRAPFYINFYGLLPFIKSGPQSNSDAINMVICLLTREEARDLLSYFRHAFFFISHPFVLTPPNQRLFNNTNLRLIPSLVYSPPPPPSKETEEQYNFKPCIISPLINLLLFLLREEGRGVLPQFL